MKLIVHNESKAKNQLEFIDLSVVKQVGKLKT